MDDASEAVGWIIRELRFERWLDALASAMEADGGEEGDERVEGTRRPA